MFAMLKAYPPLAAVLLRHGVLWFFAAASLIGTIFVYLCLPETLGKTLLEIEPLKRKK
jgi:uncharacterized membrane protein